MRYDAYSGSKFTCPFCGHHGYISDGPCCDGIPPAEGPNEPFSDPQTAIPTPYPPKAPNGPQASILPPQHVQDRMFGFPDVMRGQLALETERI